MLGKPQADKATLRHHLELQWKRSGRKPQQLEDAQECPALAIHVWNWFLELNAERGSNGMAASRITSQNMRDWCWASGNTLELWERKALRRLDQVWMEAQAKDAK